MDFWPKLELPDLAEHGRGLPQDPLTIPNKPFQWATHKNKNSLPAWCGTILLSVDPAWITQIVYSVDPDRGDQFTYFGAGIHCQVMLTKYTANNPMLFMYIEMINVPPFESWDRLYGVS